MPVTSRIVRLTLADRDGRAADCSFRPSSISSLEDTLDAYISTMVPAINGVSDSFTRKIEAVLKFDDGSAGNPAGSLVTRRCIVFWRNTDDYLASIIVPGLNEDIDSVDGYLDARIPDLSEFDALTDALSSLNALDAEGVPINGTVIAAALIV